MTQGVCKRPKSEDGRHRFAGEPQEQFTIRQGLEDAHNLRRLADEWQLPYNATVARAVRAALAREEKKAGAISVFGFRRLIG